MYPAAAILVLALVIKRRVLLLVAAAFTAIGLAVAIFHRYDQATGGVGSFCEQENPCALRWVEHFGFVTIPTMAAAGFLAATVFVGLAWRGGAYAEATNRSTGAEHGRDDIKS